MPDDLDDLKPSEVAPARQPRPRARRLTSSENVELLDDYRNGEKILELASRFGISKSTVLHHVAAAGLPRRTDSRRWSSDDLGVASAMYQDGASLAVIGDHFGLGSTTVWNRLRAAGVELRPRRGWDRH